MSMALKSVSQISVGKMPVIPLFVSQMPANQISMGLMSFSEMSVRKMSVDLIYVCQMSVGQLVFDEMTQSQKSVIFCGKRRHTVDE
jgi:hypothetical protein